MNNDYPTGKDLYNIEYGIKTRPHVVLLGCRSQVVLQFPTGE